METPDPPTSEPAPVDVAGKPLQLRPGRAAEHPFLVGRDEWLDEGHLAPPGLGPEAARRDLLLLEIPVGPGHEEELSEASLDRAPPREQQIGQGVTDPPDAELIAAAPSGKHREGV